MHLRYTFDNYAIEYWSFQSVENGYVMKISIIIMDNANYIVYKNEIYCPREQDQFLQHVFSELEQHTRNVSLNFESTTNTMQVRYKKNGRYNFISLDKVNGNSKWRDKMIKYLQIRKDMDIKECEIVNKLDDTQLTTFGKHWQKFIENCNV